jgi:hypothetical protein
MDHVPPLSPRALTDLLPVNDAGLHAPCRPQYSDGPFDRQNPDPGQAYRDAFIDDIKATIVAGVQRAYDIVQERHDEDLGYNAHTFGHDVYHIGRHQLGLCCEKSGGKLARVEELKAIFRFQGGEYTLGFYKVGRSAETNIWEAFPTSDNGTMSVNTEGQLVLLGLEAEVMDRVDDLRYVVVAHLGNPRDGLCAVYLCIPVRAENGKITGWGYAECIYKAQQGNRSIRPTAPAMPPPEHQISPVAPEEVPEGDVVVTGKETS